MRFVLSFILMITMVACTGNDMARKYGGEMTVDLPKGQKLVTVTWKEQDLWYLTREAKPGETPEKFTFREDSRFGVLNGTVTIQEH